MRKSGLITLAAAAVAAALALPAAAAAAPPCGPGAATYDSGGAATANSPNDPLFPRQWGLGQIRAPEAWNAGGTGAGATIAVVDTGVDLGHPDLQGRLVPGADFVVGGTCQPQDDEGHGTHVAGIAAADTNNGIGVAGTAPLASIMPVRVLGPDGSGGDTTIGAGIRWAAAHGAQVINLSVGPDVLPLDVSDVSTAVEEAYAAGAVVVVAAGNSTYPICSNAAAAPDAICVAAADKSGFPAFYSNFPVNPLGVAVLAPGGDAGGCSSGTDETDIWSTYWPAATDFTTGKSTDTCGPRGYEPLAGTSMATPFVSGVAAMLRGAGLDNRQTIDCIKQHSSNGGGYNPVYGYGEVNAYAAVSACTQAGNRGGSTTPGTPSGTGVQGTPQPGGTGGSTGTQQGGDVKGETDSSDSTPPRVRLAVPKDRKAHAARVGYVTARVRLDEPAKVALEVVAGRQTAVAGRNATVLAQRLVSLSTGAHSVKVRLNGTGRRVLHARRVVTVTLLALARDHAGNNGTALAEGKIRR